MKKFWTLICAVVLIAGCQNSKEPPSATSTKVPANTVEQSLGPTQSMVRSIAREVDPWDNTPVKIYPFKHALFKFKIGGPGITNGEMTLSIDDFGNLESKKSWKTRTNGQKVETWTTKESYTIYSISTADKEVVKTRLDQRISAAIDLEQLIQENGSRENALAHLSEVGIRLLPDEEIQGFPCQVYAQENARFTLTRWVYQGVEIKMAVQFEGQEQVVTRELISVDFDAEISPETFVVPEDYRLREF